MNEKTIDQAVYCRAAGDDGRRVRGRAGGHVPRRSARHAGRAAQRARRQPTPIVFGVRRIRSSPTATPSVQ